MKIGRRLVFGKITLNGRVVQTLISRVSLVNLVLAVAMVVVGPLYSSHDLCPNGAADWLFVAGICLLVTNGQFEKLTLNVFILVTAGFI